MSRRRGIAQLLCIVMIAGALAAFVAPPSEASAVLQDNTSVVMDFYAAYNARDLNKAVALFAADAVVNRPPNPSATGKAEIASWLQETWGRNVRLERPSTPQLAGDKVTVQTKISSDPLIGLGIAPLDQADEFVVQNGSIKVYTYNLTVESVSKITAAAGPPTCLPGSICPPGAPTTAPPGAPVAPIASTGAPAVGAPAALPTTGGGYGARPVPEESPIVLILALGGLALSSVRTWRRRSGRASR